MQIQQQVRRPLNILMVEDNPGDITLAENAFRKSEYAVNLITVLDGEQVLGMLHRQISSGTGALPNLIVLDLNLPQMSGHQVLEALKEDAALKHIPVIILSSSEAIQDIETSFKLHAHAYLVKPKDMVALRQLVVEIDAFWTDWVNKESEPAPKSESE